MMTGVFVSVLSCATPPPPLHSTDCFHSPNGSPVVRQYSADTRAFHVDRMYCVLLGTDSDASRRSDVDSDWAATYRYREV